MLHLGSTQIAACIIAASFHIAVGLAMAYSATLIPHLEKEDAEVHATKEQTSWIGKIKQIFFKRTSQQGNIAETKRVLLFIQ